MDNIFVDYQRVMCAFVVNSNNSFTIGQAGRIACEFVLGLKTNTCTQIAYVMN